MKRVVLQFAQPALSAIAATALLAAIAFASPAEARKVSTGSAAHEAKEEAETAEARIKHLHDTLQITAAQEDQWNKVAAVIRDNADRLTALAKARLESGKTMTAVDDLKSYADITEAHEKGIEKLLPVFTKLYDGLSDVQKKAADTEFREHHEHHHHHPMS